MSALRRIRVPEAANTSTATTMAAIGSAMGCPASTRIRPTTTATVPARSPAKCRAPAASAGLPCRRDARHDAVARAASSTITNASVP